MGRHKKVVEPSLSQDVQKTIDKLKANIKSKMEDGGGNGGDTVSTDDMFHYGPPVSPKEFIESKEYYGNCEKKTVYPWIIDDLEEIFSGPWHSPKYQTVVELLGTGSGKSYFAGMADAYLVYWLRSFKSLSKFFATKGISWDDSATLCFINMAPTKGQAEKIVFERIKQTVYGCKIFRDRNWLPNPNITKELHFDEIDPSTNQSVTKISIVPGNSSETFTLGYSIFGGIIDEANFFVEKNSNPVIGIFEEMNGRRKSRFQGYGLIMLTSSAKLETDLTEELGEKSKTDPTIFFKRRARYECKPEFFSMPKFSMEITREKANGVIEKVMLHPPISLQQEYIDNKPKALCDIEAIPSLAGSPFYPDHAILLSRINTARTDPFPDLGLEKPEGAQDLKLRIPNAFVGDENCKYRIHVDLAKGNVAKGNCGVGFAMCHKILDAQKGFKVKLDMAVRFKAPEDQIVDVMEILNFIAYLKKDRKFNIDMVTFDQYQSQLPTQIINKWNIGIESKELKVDYQVHTYLRGLIVSNQFDFFYDQNLIYELKRMEDHGNRVEPGVGSFLDEADATAGSAYACSALEAEAEKNPPPPPRAAIGRVIPRGVGVASVAKYRQNTNFMPRYKQGR